MLDVIHINMWIHYIGHKLLIVDRTLNSILNCLLGCIQVDRLQKLAWAAVNRLLAFQDSLLDILREALVWLTHHSFHKVDYRLWECKLVGLCNNIFCGQVVLNQEHCHVGNNLGRRCNLDYIAEQLVNVVVHLLALFPLVNQAKSCNLRLEVGVLSARNLVVVNLGSTCLKVALESAVVCADNFPVVGQWVKTVDIDTGVALLTCQCSYNCVKAWLRCYAGNSRDCCIYNIYTCIGSAEQCCNSVSGCVVCMQLDWNSNLFLKSLYKFGCGIWFDKTCHILDSQDVGSHSLKLFCHAYIVLKAILVALRIFDIACVAHGCLAQLASLENCIHWNRKTLCVVQTVEHSEQVYSTFCSLVNELVDNVVRIVCVSYCVGRS